MCGARQVSADRLVAYKTVTSGRLASAAERRRFQTEIESAARLDHPNIVPIYEVGEDEGRPFFTMRLMEGGTLAQRISNLKSGNQLQNPVGADVRRLKSPGDQSLLTSAPTIQEAPPPISIHAAARLLAKVARAVHFAHERGILHRDLKPGNILLDTASEPFVADFGLARQLELDSSLTLSGDVLGTPAYLAPEVAAGGSRAATIASDIYSLGAVLYELLTGRPPLLAPTVPELLRRIVEQDPVPPNQFLRHRRAEAPPEAGPSPTTADTAPVAPTHAAGAPNSSSARTSGTGEPDSRRIGLRRSAARTPAAIPRDLETICLKCLAKTPAARYASAAALADDLERWLRGDPIRARPATPLELGLKWVRRHRVGAALLGVAAILPAVIIAALLWVNTSRGGCIRSRSNRCSRSSIIWPIPGGSNGLSSRPTAGFSSAPTPPNPASGCGMRARGARPAGFPAIATTPCKWRSRRMAGRSPRPAATAR